MDCSLFYNSKANRPSNKLKNMESMILKIYQVHIEQRNHPTEYNKQETHLGITNDTVGIF